MVNTMNFNKSNFYTNNGLSKIIFNINRLA
jgi:hypothetical protein